jgi:hypothetical protein
MESFKTLWHNEVETAKEGSNKDLPIPQLDPKTMDKFVNHSFWNWVWSSNKQFAKDLECQRQILQIEERKAKTDHTRSLIHHYYTDLLQSMKKERRFFRKEFASEGAFFLGNHNLFIYLAPSDTLCHKVTLICLVLTFVWLIVFYCCLNSAFVLDTNIIMLDQTIQFCLCSRLLFFFNK